MEKEEMKTIDLDSNSGHSLDIDNSYTTNNFHHNFEEYENSIENNSMKKIINYEDIKVINKLSIFYQLLKIIMIGIFTFRLLHYYLVIQYGENQSIKNSPPSNLLLTGIITLIFQFTISYNTLIIKLQRYGMKFPKKIWERIVIFNSDFYAFCKNITFCVLQIITMTLSPMFIPFNSNNCNGYSYSVCGFLRFISFFGIIMIITYGIILLLTITSVLIFEKNGVKQMRTQSWLYRTIFDVSIFGIFKLYDDTCVICFSEKEYGKLHFIKFKCGHRFHRDCADQWAQRHTSCPICRQEVLKNPNDNEKI